MTPNISRDIGITLIDRSVKMLPVSEEDIIPGKSFYRVSFSNKNKVFKDTIRSRINESRWSDGETEEEYQEYINFYKNLVKSDMLLKIENIVKRNTNEEKSIKKDIELFS